MSFFEPTDSPFPDWGYFTRLAATNKRKRQEKSLALTHLQDSLKRPKTFCMQPIAMGGTYRQQEEEPKISLYDNPRNGRDISGLFKSRWDKTVPPQPYAESFLVQLKAHRVSGQDASLFDFTLPPSYPDPGSHDPCFFDGCHVIHVDTQQQQQEQVQQSGNLQTWTQVDSPQRSPPFDLGSQTTPSTPPLLPSQISEMSSYDDDCLSHDSTDQSCSLFDD